MKIWCTIVILVIAISSQAQHTQYQTIGNVPSNFAIHPDDLTALVAMYNALDGPNWTIQEFRKWDTSNPNYQQLYPFMWIGLHFNISNHRVAGITIINNIGMKGTIPAEISLLQDLEFISILDNEIEDISNLRNLPKLNRINFSRNKINGSLPCIFDNLPMLKNVLISHNQITSIPECIVGIKNTLRQLILSNNNIASPLPEVLCTFPLLNSTSASLYLNNNQLTGCIPPCFKNLCTSTQFTSGNNFTNTCDDIRVNPPIPCEDLPCHPQNDILRDFYQAFQITQRPVNATSIDSDGNVVNVTPWTMQDAINFWRPVYEGIGYTNWTGIESIKALTPYFKIIDFDLLYEFYVTNLGNPSSFLSDWEDDCDPCGLIDGTPWLGLKCNSNNEVTHINLPGRGLTGEIPNSLGDLSSLQVLNLAINNINGQIPASFSNLTKLQILNLEANLIQDQIPQYLPNLTYLQYLNLSHNEISGTIPSNLGELQYLKELDLAYNRLTGTIPGSLGNLEQLQILDLTSNNLSGSIPSSLGSIQPLSFLSVLMNNLNGNLPSTLGDLPNLNYLIVSQNNLSGTLDNNLSKLCGRIGINGYTINSMNSFNNYFNSLCTNCTLLNVVIDGDNNTYHPFQIGNQTWLQENLMATKCLDGSPITTTNGQPAYTWLANDITNKHTYGAYYSHYILGTMAQINLNNQTINVHRPTCNICPSGYRIASTTDYQTLFTYLSANNLSIINQAESCFLPIYGGFMTSSNAFPTNLGSMMVAWSSTFSSGPTGWDIHIDNNGNTGNNNGSGYHLQPKEEFRTIRCIKE